MWTEYSTAKPTLRTKDMFEKPVRLTSAKMLRPTTVTSDKIIVTAISKDPIKLPQKTLDWAWRFSKESFTNKNKNAIANPETIA